MAERPWWKRIDSQPPSPKWWEDSPLARVGFIFSLVWGGGLVFRMIFPEELGGGAWLYAVLTLASLVVLAAGIAQARKRSDG